MLFAFAPLSQFVKTLAECLQAQYVRGSPGGCRHLPKLCGSFMKLLDRILGQRNVHDFGCLAYHLCTQFASYPLPLAEGFAERRYA